MDGILNIPYQEWLMSKGLLGRSGRRGYIEMWPNHGLFLQGFGYNTSTWWRSEHECSCSAS